jgi:hypothetical protein
LCLFSVSVSHADLVALWQFYSNSGAQPDATTNGNNATPNGATWVHDVTRDSGTMSFDGSDDFLNVPDSPSLSITGDITLAAWVNVGGTPGGFENWRGVMGKGAIGSSVPASYQFFFNQNDLNPGFLRGNGTSQAIFHSGAGAGNVPSHNSWEHWAVTMSGTSVKVYRNGAQVGPTGTISISMGDNDGPLYIGNRPNLQLDFLGRMDDVAIFNEALSVGQIGDIMSGDFTAFGVPEPGACVLFAVGGALILAGRLRRNGRRTSDN